MPHDTLPVSCLLWEMGSVYRAIKGGKEDEIPGGNRPADPWPAFHYQ